VPFAFVAAFVLGIIATELTGLSGTFRILYYAAMALLGYAQRTAPAPRLGSALGVADPEEFEHAQLRLVSHPNRCARSSANRSSTSTRSGGRMGLGRPHASTALPWTTSPPDL
jgi:hypothetical protein